MDRNQIIGIVLITAMMIGYIFFQKTQEPAEVQTLNTEEVNNTADNAESSASTAPKVEVKDNLEALGEEKTIYTHETKDLIIEFSNYGAQVRQVILKNFKDYHGGQLKLLTPKSSEFYFQLDENTDSRKLGFTSPSSVSTGENNATIVSFATENYTLKYSIPEEGYKVGFTVVKSNGSAGNFSFDWKQKIYRLERGEEESINRSGVNYYNVDGDFDDVGTGSGSDNERIEYPVRWFSHKQRFFNSGLITENNSIQNLDVNVQTLEGDTTYIKQFESKGSIAFVDQQINADFYFGPNDYKVLKKVTDGYDKNVYMGWFIFSYINKFLVVPIFKFLEGFITNYGLIIFLLVVIIKMLLFPIAYKSYLSMAKMKELKPEIDAIKERVGDNPQEVQQEQMKLYNQVGVNPLSGCIPMVLQMPILLALFNFFPNSIELRQESFLWAHDLSTYDAPIQFDFNIPFLGDHISLFTLLMTLSTIAYTYYNNQINSAATQGPYKYMGYLMPVIFFFVLNNFSSGLTYYYFISNIITISQQQIATRFIDKDKIRQTMEENKKAAKAGKKKQSKFQQRLQEAMKAQQEARKNDKNK